MSLRPAWPLALLCFVTAVAGLKAAESSGPRIVVDQARHEFGLLSVGSTGKHDFTITNAGTRPLTLNRGKSSCGCCTCVCIMNLPGEAALAPGSSAKVRLEWTSSVYSGPFRHTETLLSNDRQQPEVMLQAIGRYGTPLRLAPADLVLTHVLPGQSAAGEVRLFAYVRQRLEIAGWTWSDPAMADKFDLALEPLPAEQLREEFLAYGGYRVRVGVKPGLPLGPFRQRVLLKTNLSAQPTVELQVQGEVAPEITIVGRDWNGRTGALAMGTIDGRQGTSRTLWVTARGPHAKDLRLSVMEVSPAWLSLEIGKTSLRQDASTATVPLTIRIPMRAEPSAHLGGDHGEPGRIVLRTDHPQIPELRMQIRFAVQR